jgi:putative salt-induced outer membrane protein YdiY
MRKTLVALVCCMTMSVPSYAIDQVETLDGGILTGTIKSISEAEITLSTSYAGVLTLKRNQIKGFNTDETVFVRLKSGTTLEGQIHHEGEGQLVITGQDAIMTTKTTSIAESWLPEANDPQLVRSEQQRDALKRKWSYEAALDIVGKKGNSDQFGASVKLMATLESPDDTLKFYTSLDKESKNKVDTANEIIFGSEYTAYFADPWGWYVRGEVERDDFENLELRTLFGSGLNYRVLHQDKHSLELRSGLGYRYESFTDGTNESSPTLDFGIVHKWQFVDWAKMTNHLTYTPAINDFSDFLLTHDSGINIPIGFSNFWNLRFGLRNDYKSMPAEGREKLDTSYYSRLQLKW